MTLPNLSGIVLKLGTLLVEEGVYLYGVDAKIQWVTTELNRMKIFFENHESKWNSEDPMVKNWVKELTDVAHQIEDLIDLIENKNETRRRGKGIVGSISRYAHFPDEITTLHKVGAMIDQIKAKLEDISQSNDRYGILNPGNRREGESSGGDEMVNVMRLHSPHFVDDMEVVGFDGYASKITQRLLNEQNTTRSVISIVAMGGSGKTTLARKVFGSPLVKETFSCFAWTAVSQKRRIFDLLKEIAKQVMLLGKSSSGQTEGETSSSLSVEKLKDMGEMELKTIIYEFLQGKKYLVVLDDVWNPDDWNRIGHIFPVTNNGSKILLTTRNMEVAEYADPRSLPLELHLLDDEQSWELLRKKFFPRNQAINVPNLDKLYVLGHTLASKCGGLPLLLVVLAGLLSRNLDYDSWSKLADTMNWESMTDGQRCTEILALSYKDLPNSHIKSCYLYISSFPKDILISPSKLIRLWVAEGLIPHDERCSLEEAARRYLDKMIQRCLIQVAELSKTREWVKKIHLHDMLRDWCIKEAQSFGFLKIINTQENPENPIPTTGISNDNRVVLNNISMDVPEKRFVASIGNPRTILDFNMILSGKSQKTIGRFSLLRVLDLQGSLGEWDLPEQIDELVHLRYLGLRDTEVSKIPSSIDRLLYLRTFDARGTKITTIPTTFWKIKSLEYVYLPCLLEQIPKHDITKSLLKLYVGLTKSSQILNLRALHGLTMFSQIINFRALHGLTKFSQIINLRALRELLLQQDKFVALTLDVLTQGFQKGNIEAQFSCVEDIVSHRDPRNMVPWFFDDIKQLRFLKLRGEMVKILDEDEILPVNLTEFTLKTTVLDPKAVKALRKLPNLMLLRLRARTFYGPIRLFSSGGFPSLRHLSVEWILIVEMDTDMEVGTMPSLITLHINGCFYMKKIPRGLRYLVSLKELRLGDIPRKIERRIANDTGEDWHIINHIPSIIIHRPFGTAI